MSPRRARPGPRTPQGVGGDEAMALAAVLAAAVLAGRRGLHRLDRVPAPLLALAAAGVLVALGLGAIALGRRRRVGKGSRRPPRTGREEAPGARWASSRELRRLWAGPHEPGRLVLGSHARKRLRLERGHSLLVVGPTQSGKTSGLAVPAILEWEGPVVATSVKTDLLGATFGFRSRLGRALVYDPAGVAGCPRAAWSPLAGAHSWEGARRAAAGLCSVARAGAGSGLEDGGFWYAMAEKLLAPLLLAAARSGATMRDVVRWVDTGEIQEVVLALELAGETEALQAAEASFTREERQRSSIYTTAEAVLAAFADPLVAACSSGDDVDVERLVAGGGSDTLYLVAPAHEQERLQAPFVCLLRAVLDAAFTAAARARGALDPPLLLVLDEAANVAPLAGLDGLVATAASQGVQVVTLWQDLAQIEARHGARAATVVNNHRAKLLCPGVSDPSTLDQIRRLAGDTEAETRQTTRDANGGWSSTTGTEIRPLAPADALRRLAPGEAVLVYADLPPARLRLRPYFDDPELARRSAGRVVSRAARRRGARGRGRRGRPRRWRRG